MSKNHDNASISIKNILIISIIKFKNALTKVKKKKNIY